MSKPENLPGNDSIRPGQLDPGPLTKEHIKGAVARLEKLNGNPLTCPMAYYVGPVWETASVYETPHYSNASDMYRQVVRDVNAGKSFNDRHMPGKVVKGIRVHMTYDGENHYIGVYGLLEKMPEVEP